MMNKQQIFESLGLERPAIPESSPGPGSKGPAVSFPSPIPPTVKSSPPSPRPRKPTTTRSSKAPVEPFEAWRTLPAPKRGEYVRLLGHALREKKQALGALVSLEMGKIRAEGEGEVQEMIDICDFSVGLSRQLYGLSMVSERPLHRMYEQWHPLGPVGVIIRFQLPRGRVVLERSHRRGLWRQRCLEAVVGDSADGRRRDPHRRERDGRFRVRGRVQPGGRTRLGRRRSHAAATGVCR